MSDSSNPKRQDAAAPPPAVALQAPGRPQPRPGLLGRIAPAWALRRAQARALLMTRLAFDAATIRPTNYGWTAPSGSMNAETKAGLPQVRVNARDLVQNNPYARRVVDLWTAHIIGTGIHARPQGVDKAVADKLIAAWDAWAGSTNCDYAGESTWAELQALAVRTLATSGEVLIRMYLGDEKDALPLRLQVLEPDYLDTSHDTTTAVKPTGKLEIQGIEYDSIGRRAAYWLYPLHPGDYGAAQTSVRVPAKEVLHILLRDRPGQARGVPWLAPVVLTLKDLGDYREALLARAKTEACLGVFIQTAEVSINNLTAKAGSITTPDEFPTFRPGMVGRLAPGEEPKFLEPTAGGGHAGFERAALSAVAIGTGLTYAQVAGDLTGANYSSLRAGNIDQRRILNQRQQAVIAQMCAPVWRAFCEAGRAAGLWPKMLYPARFRAPRSESVDPGRDGLAMIRDVRAGLRTLPDAIAEYGGDPATAFAEIEETNILLDKGKIILDTDPRNTTLAGIYQANPAEG